MKLEIIIEKIKDLKKSFEDEQVFKMYCEEKHISRLFLASLLTKDIETLEYREAFTILDSYPDDIPFTILITTIGDLLEFKKVFEDGLI